MRELKNKLKKDEKEIRVLMAKEGDPAFLDAWFDKDCQSLGGKTPRQVINEGNAEFIKNLLRQIFKYDKVAKETTALLKTRKLGRGGKGNKNGLL